MMKIRVGIYNEMIKLMYRKRYSYLLMLVFLISISMGLIGKFVNGIIGLYISNFPITVLSVLMTFVLSFIIFMVVADLFTLEQEDGTIKAVLTRPVSRIGVYISKILVIFIYTCMILLVGLISSLICGVFF
ncbi:MAG: ABC transporter permease [Thermoanaerobacterium sp.]|nr:ABC transporter permease [Thermoanaerobacterium sp.]